MFLNSFTTFLNSFTTFYHVLPCFTNGFIPHGFTSRLLPGYLAQPRNFVVLFYESNLRESEEGALGWVEF